MFGLDWFCPREKDIPVCQSAMADIRRRLEKIEADGQARQRMLEKFSEAFKSHIYREETDIAQLLEEVRALVTVVKPKVKRNGP